MIEPAAKQQKPAKIEYASQVGWPLGVISRLDADRTPAKAISIAENVELSQNGTIKPRPGLKLYYTPANPVLGEVFEFVKFSGTTPETWLIWGENDGGTGKIYVNKDGGVATLVTGQTYDSVASLHYEQIANKVVIMNGVDELSYMDIDALTITTFTALTTPTITSLTPTGMSAGSYSIRYKVTATNAVGETIASTADTDLVDETRDEWDGTNEYVTLVFPRVTNAERYNIYFGDQAGLEYYFDSITDPGTGTDVTYIDKGTLPLNVTRLAPIENSTAGPKVTRATNIKGELYMTGDTDNPSRVWFGGNQGDTTALNFTFFQGGGWVEPNKGGKDQPIKMKPFRDGKGTPMAACLSKGTNGAGKRYLFQRSSVTVGDVIIPFMSVQEDNGQDGTDSPDGVVLLDDALFYPSRTGFKTTTTKAQIQNILSTSTISDNIDDVVNTLSSNNMDNCVGLTHDRKIYWTLPFQSSTNNQVWTLDLRQKGAWMRPWNLNVTWMTLYSDNSDGMTKVIFVQDDKFYELDESLATNDEGVAFTTSVGSGAIKFSEDGEQYGSVVDVTFIVLSPQGEVNLTVNVNTEDGPVVFTDQVDSTTNSSTGGFGAYQYGDVGLGNLYFGEPLAVSSNIARVRKTIEIDEECNYLTWAINTTNIGVDYELAAVIIRYVAIGWIDTE